MSEQDDIADLVRWHVRFGWWALFCFATLGLVLETLHGFKLGLYLDVQNETRRLLWTLAHAHGVLLAILHLVLAGSLQQGWLDARAPLSLISRLFTAAALLLPLGFFAGGIVVHAGDPNLAVLLASLGGLCLLAALALTARAASRGASG